MPGTIPSASPVWTEQVGVALFPITDAEVEAEEWSNPLKVTPLQVVELEAEPSSVSWASSSRFLQIMTMMTEALSLPLHPGSHLSPKGKYSIRCLQ